MAATALKVLQLSNATRRHVTTSVNKARAYEERKANRALTGIGNHMQVSRIVRHRYVTAVYRTNYALRCQNYNDRSVGKGIVLPRWRAFTGLAHVLRDGLFLRSFAFPLEPGEPPLEPNHPLFKPLEAVRRPYS